MLFGNTPLLEDESTSDIELTRSGGLDTDGDRIPDIGEIAIGIDPKNTDSDGDGISDSAEIEQGLDPLGDRGFPTGMISSIPLEGEAREIVIEGSTLDTGNQTAYIATGSYGLAAVDTSNFDNPIVLGQLDLEGDNIDVAVDNDLQTVAIASQNGGLHLVDVSDPMLPTLNETLNFSVSQVEVWEGLAYATIGTELKVIDLLMILRSLPVLPMLPMVQVGYLWSTTLPSITKV